MKILVPAIVLSAVCAFPLFAEEESYVLFKADEPMPKGKALESESLMDLQGGAVSIKMQEQPMDGTTDMKTVEKRRVEGLANGDYRIIIKDDSQSQTMNLMGQPHMIPPTVNPLVGKPVLATKDDDGVWSAKLEEGDPSPEMTTELEDIADSLNNNEDEKFYGTEARKVGDEWEVDGADLMGVENGKGMFKVKLAGIEEYEGEQCAKITGTFKIKGDGTDGDVDAGEMIISLEGDYVAYRSLEFRYDLSKVMTGTMNIDGDMEPAPGMAMKINIQGDVSAEATAKLVEVE